MAIKQQLKSFKPALDLFNKKAPNSGNRKKKIFIYKDANGVHSYSYHSMSGLRLVQESCDVDTAFETCQVLNNRKNVA